MPTDLMLPAGLAPSNLHLRPTVKAKFVENDVFDIARRLAEVSPTLKIWELTEDDKDHAAWLITETVRGKEEYVKKYQQLDARMIDDVQKMRRIPLTTRVALAQKEIDEANAKLDEENMDKLVETMGLPMHRLLHECGFIEGRGRSYAKRGVRPS